MHHTAYPPVTSALSQEEALGDGEEPSETSIIDAVLEENEDGSGRRHIVPLSIQAAMQEQSNTPPQGIRKVLKGLLSMLGFESDNASSLHESVKEILVDYEESNDPFSHQERLLLMNSIRFFETKVEEVMVPRSEIQAIDVDGSFEEIHAFLQQSTKHRFPIFSSTMDEPLGMVYMRDLLLLLLDVQKTMQGEEGRRQEGTLREAILSLRKDILFIPPSMSLANLLLKMQKSKTHIALVVDEYGGTDGLMSISNLLEALVGNIGELDEEDLGQSIVQVSQGIFDIDARTPIDVIESTLGLDLFQQGDSMEEELETLGGFVAHIAKRVPATGEEIIYNHLQFEILDASPMHIKRIRLKL